MSAPAWLPPLNSHELFVTTVSVEEADDILERPAVLPIEGWEADGVFCIEVVVSVRFFKENHYFGSPGFPGLFLKHRFSLSYGALGCDCEFFRAIISAMLRFMKTPYALDQILYFRESGVLLNQHSLIHQIMEDLHDRKSRSFSNILPVRWNIFRDVEISSDEYDAWTSWYAEKVKVNPNFAEEYIAAISRPRTNEELLYEVLVRFRAATASSIEALEVVKVEEDLDSTRNCLVCLEDFSAGSVATRLPCSHVFHKECIVKWLQESHMCPLCRFTLPTSGNN